MDRYTIKQYDKYFYVPYHNGQMIGRCEGYVSRREAQCYIEYYKTRH